MRSALAQASEWTFPSTGIRANCLAGQLRAKAPTRVGLRSPPVSRLASVFPLVSARALARPFTYEVPDEVGKGAVVEIRFANARRRGVVVDVDVEAPEGVEPAAIERVLEELPRALVDLALWLADYYGSTPARALGLVAPE